MISRLRSISYLSSALAAAVLLLASPSFAEDDIMAYGPKVGDAIPHSLDAVNQDGDAVSLDTLTGDKGLILLFVRSVDWCPFCKTQVLDWNGQAGKFKDLGYEVAALSYDPVEKAKKFQKERDLSIPVISDAGSEIIKGFGILNEEHEPGSFAYGIPHPFIYVITPDGTITHRFAEASYRDRPPVPLVYQSLTDGT